MVPLDRALVSSYRLSIVTMSLTAAVWPQFATQVFRGGIGRLTCIGSYLNKQVTTFTFRAQATCSKHHTRTVMDAGCECAPWVRSANPSDSWALVYCQHDNSWTAVLSLMKLCMSMYLDNRQNPIEFQGRRSRVKVTCFFVFSFLHNTDWSSWPAFTTSHNIIR